MSQYSIKDELNYLEPKKIRIRKDEFHNLQLKVEDGKDYPEIDAVMGFPLTDPNRIISLIEVKNGKRDNEIGIIEDIKKLD